MKKAALVLMAVFMMIATMPVLAQTTNGENKAEKDQCLLYSKNCSNEVDTIQKRIKKLQKEIKKGKKVYSPEELKKLEEKLKEVNEILDELESGGN
jgi:peptidoglycan hydrolase CwlO-like protein